ncbi:hypothetical protein LOK49_LG05G01334 [Camellia lanceoleosa]|uniref:Uncharacterized protein n=1 Tax=Camellia lanceoleosa TaxID=1840588 RepID=A0ACC0HTP5_9ERIC|nr:hypothetical protein LOK49_LG05G01334 [Camellia lanceoleosa]
MAYLNQSPSSFRPSLLMSLPLSPITVVDSSPLPAHRRRHPTILNLLDNHCYIVSPYRPWPPLPFTFLTIASEFRPLIDSLP